MKSFLVALALCLLVASPEAKADPEGTVAGAKREIARYKKQHRQIQYFTNKNQGLAELADLAYCYEGMQLERSTGDFMKNHRIMIVPIEKKRIGKNKLRLKEMVVYPMFSVRNDHHVLRGADVVRVVPILKGKYVGVDGKWHKV